MAPETKVALDYLLAFLGTGGCGGLLLALVGVWKARVERPAHIAAPNTGTGALAQIGGMVMGQQLGQDLLEALRSIAASHDRCTLAREAEMLARKELWRERREHERRLSEDRHDDHREMLDQVKTLNDRLRDTRLAGS